MKKCFPLQVVHNQTSLLTMFLQELYVRTLCAQSTDKNIADSRLENVKGTNINIRA